MPPRPWIKTMWLFAACLAVPASAQPKDPKAETAPPSGRIVYRGSYDVVVEPARQVLPRSLQRGRAHQARRKQGRMEIVLQFSGANATAELSLDGGAPVLLTGTVRDGICTLSGTAGEEVHRGRCDSSGFAGTISAPSGAPRTANGTFQTTAVQAAAAAAPRTRAPSSGRATVSMAETRALVASGGEGSRPGGPNSWLTIMPAGFGKYFPPAAQAAAIQRAAETALVADLQNYPGATLVPGSFYEPAYYRSATAPGETWVRLNYKYSSAFGEQEGWVESRLIGGQVACVRHHHQSACNPPKASIAQQRASLARFSPKLGPIVIPASCVKEEFVEGTPSYRPIIGNDPNTAPIYGAPRGGSASYTKRTYTCETRAIVLECRWGRYDPVLRRGEDLGLFSEVAANAAIARGDCVRTK